MADQFLVPDGESYTELTVKNSKFIGQCFPVKSEKEVKEIIKNLRELHPGARHVVYAFKLGMKNSQTLGMSDDGEPKGTAGRPALQVLDGSNVTNVLCTIVRYFGGTLLGTGGLVKAYTQSTKDAIANLKTKIYVEEISINLTAPYELYNQVKYIIEKSNIKICKEEFKENIIIEIKIAKDELEIFQDKIREISSGTIEIR